LGWLLEEDTVFRFCKALKLKP